MPDTKIACPYCAADESPCSYKSAVFFEHIFKNHENDIFNRKPFHRVDHRGQLHNLKHPFHMVLAAEKAQTGEMEESVIKRYVCLGCHKALLKTDKNAEVIQKHIEECPSYKTAIGNLREKYPIAAVTAGPRPAQQEVDPMTAAINNLQTGSGLMDSLNGSQTQVYHNVLRENKAFKSEADESHRKASALAAELNKWKYLAIQMSIQAAVARAVSFEDTKIHDKLEKKKHEFQEKPFLNTIDNPQIDNFFIQHDDWYGKYNLNSITFDEILKEFKKHECTIVDDINKEEKALKVIDVEVQNELKAREAAKKARGGKEAV